MDIFVPEKPTEGPADVTPGAWQWRQSPKNDSICVFKKLFYIYIHTHTHIKINAYLCRNIWKGTQLRTGWEIGISRIIFIKIYIFLYLIIDSFCIAILLLSKKWFSLCYVLCGPVGCISVLFFGAGSEACSVTSLTHCVVPRVKRASSRVCLGTWH